MNGIKERIAEKEIILWGMGRLSFDLEAFYAFPNLLFYIDDEVQEENRFCLSDKAIYSWEILKEEGMAQRNLLIIVCVDETYAIPKLKALGYQRENYMLGKELLENVKWYDSISSHDISVWGIGNSYYHYENDIREYLPRIKHFIVNGKEEKVFQGRNVLDGKQIILGDTYIAVASIYYQEIYKDLMHRGLKPGRDFAHVETLLSMGKLSRLTGTNYQMDERRKDAKELVIILAGYKEFVWESVFDRLVRYLPQDKDVCVVSSGQLNHGLRKMCETYGWSYISTQWNNVSLAINLAIWKHPEAEYIYKLDEDIFVTDGVFETVRFTYDEVEKKGKYHVGFVSPLISVNGYGYARLLEILGKVELWEEQFGKLKYGGGAIYVDPKAARFMWELGELDEIQNILKEREFQYSACPMLYSIGFILFRRKDWIRMGMFPMLKHKNIGADEEYLCNFCMKSGLAIVVAENAVAGHLSYGPQNQEMKSYYLKHKKKFCV